MPQSRGSSERGEGGYPGGPESSVDSDLRDQDYRADVDPNQRPSNIIMLRMLPPNATVNEVSGLSAANKSACCCL